MARETDKYTSSTSTRETDELEAASKDPCDDRDEGTAVPAGEPTSSAAGTNPEDIKATNFGRTCTIVENALFDNSVKPRQLSANLQSSLIHDSIRAGSGKFYTTTTQKQMRLFSEINSSLSLPLNMLIHDTANYNETDETWQQSITLEFNEEELYPGVYSNPIRESVDVEYTDTLTKMSYPASKSYIDSLGVVNNPSYVDVRSFYNFFEEGVESRCSDPTLKEQESIPNFYSFYLQEEPEVPTELILVEPTSPLEVDPPRSEYEEPESPGFAADPDALARARASSDSGRDFSDVIASSGKSETVIKAIKASIDEHAALSPLVKSKYNKTFMMSYDGRKLKEISQNKSLFPMYVDIEFSTDPTTVFADTVKQAKLSKIVQKDICYSYLRTATSGYSRYVEMDFSENIENLFQTKPGVLPVRKYELSQNTRKVVSLSDLLDSIDSPKSYSLSDQSVYFYDEDESLSYLQPSPTPTFDRSLMVQILKQKVKMLVRQKLRTFRQMIQGVPCYSETILYRVEKRRGDGQKVQDFYFLNSTEINVQKFIDTQVKYDQEYVYDLFSYEMVIGTKYSYSGVVPISTAAESFHMVTLTTTCKPNLLVIENRLSSSRVRIVDSPSVAPEVEFVPHKGKNLVKILLNNNFDSYIKTPLMIDSGEAVYLNEIIRNQNLGYSTPHILYRTDDHAVAYEIYRTTIKPKSYLDFSGQLLATVSTDVSEATPQKATSATYEDLLSPNTKYYYAIRSRDVHDNLSYPSEVHQIEVVRNSGITYMTHEICEMNVKPKRNLSRGMKRHIKISPAIDQSTVAPETLNKTHIELGNVKLGTAEQTLWNKKFKMRITSKSTGRRAEVDFRFTHKHETDDS